MNQYGSVENYCRELQAKISRLHNLMSLHLPNSVDQRNMEATANAFQEVYFDLVDSDLYRR